MQRRAKRKGRKLTYKTNGPNKEKEKKNQAELNLNIHVILTINGIQLKVKNCQTRLKNKTSVFKKYLPKKGRMKVNR